MLKPQNDSPAVSLLAIALSLLTALASAPAFAITDETAPPSAELSEAKTAMFGRGVFNPRIRPLGTLFGVYGGDLGIGFGDSWSLGPSAARAVGTVQGIRTTAVQVGFVATYYLNHDRRENGWIIRSASYYVPVWIYDKPHQTNSRFDDFILGAIGGRHWVNSWGMTVDVGAGLAFYKSESDTLSDSNATRSSSISTSRGIQPIYEFALGWLF